MARPRRCRRVCAEPVYGSFCPAGNAANGEVMLTLDEYEAIRLIDLEKLTHAQCAVQMDISRTTVTEIYELARTKLADVIVNGKSLFIAGGITACVMALPLLPAVVTSVAGNFMRAVKACFAKRKGKRQ